MRKWGTCWANWKEWKWSTARTGVIRDGMIGTIRLRSNFERAGRIWWWVKTRWSVGGRGGGPMNADCRSLDWTGSQNESLGRSSWGWPLSCFIFTMHYLGLLRSSGGEKGHGVLAPGVQEVYVSLEMSPTFGTICSWEIKPLYNSRIHQNWSTG